MPAATRTPEAEGVEVVFVGSFNPAIFHPEWFFRQGIIGEQDAKEAKIQDVSGEITVVQLCGMHLQCIGDRFSIATANISIAERIHDFILQTFTLLSHTPIKACGINPHIHYSIGNIDYWHRIGHTLAPKELIWSDLFDEPGMQSLTIKAHRKGEFAGEINVTVEPSAKFPPGLFVRTNYHYGLPTDTIHAGAAEQALKFLKAEWKAAGSMARKVAEQIFTKINLENV